MNKYRLFIDNVEYKNANIPFKFGEYLDKELDHAIVQLTRVNKQYFEPTTPVKVEITDKNGDIKTLHYIISNDNFKESPVGSGYYRHDLTLIEPTKLLEGIPVETLCFTNAGASNGNSPMPFTIFDIYAVGRVGQTDKNIIKRIKDLIFKNGITIPIAVNETITFPSAKSLISAYIDGKKETDPNFTYQYEFISAAIKLNSENYLLVTENDNEQLSVVIQDKHNKLIYEIVTSASYNPIKFELMFDFSAVEHYNPHPLVPWNIESVINRVLELERPLIYDNNTGGFVKEKRFKLGETSKDLSKILAPEFTFARQSLREVLQTIGSYIHAEPRLLFNEETKEFDTITYDFYGEQKFATYKNVVSGKEERLSTYNYEDLSGKYGIEQACTALDSYMDNLINKVKDNASAVGQPYIGGYQSLRTENSNVRFTDAGEVYFPTAYPVQQIHKFTVHANGEVIDITPVLYDERIYNAQLSSYDDILGSSKSYALYYKQNGKGIYGFFFLNNELLFENAFNNYAISKILSAYSNGSVAITKLEDILNLGFELVYTPIYSTRITHSKSYIGDWLKYPRILNYSQGANSVEMESFGENIKGAVERMGTLEKSYTFTCFNLDTIPSAGELWDEDYYISTVSVEVGKEKFKVTCGLSKHFNRISEYITVSSYKRLYEVSEVMTQERGLVYKDYMVITSDEVTDYVANKDALHANDIFLYAMQSTFTQETDIANVEKISSVNARLYTKQFNALTAVTLPVISSACGNTMDFTWEYKDNYSAGQKRITIENDGTNNYYGQEVEYSDYYGRGYYERFALVGKEIEQNEEAFANLPQMQSGGQYSVIEIPQSCYMLTRKDSRETLKRTYAVEFVTDNNKFIIGSALASNCPLVAGKNPLAKAKLVLLRKRINRFDKTINPLDIIKSYDVDGLFSIENGILKCAGKDSAYEFDVEAWAYVTPLRNGQTTTYSDENGEIVEITEQYGGELLLGCNVRVKGTDKFGTFNMYPTHDIYDYLKQKNQGEDTGGDDTGGDDIPTEQPTQGLAYELSSDGTYYTCTGIGTATDTDIVIASQIDGIPVTEIGDYAFYGNETIISVKIPNSVTTIYANAFRTCTSLIEITIPDSVTNIGTYLAYGCEKLENVTIGNSVTEIAASAFRVCKELKTINIPNSVTKIGGQAFRGDASLEKIVIPNSVVTINADAFRDCSKLTIYCEAESQPSGWVSGWNPSNRPVVWGYKGE